MDLNKRKWKIIHPPPSEESHPVTDPLGMTVEEAEDKIIFTKSKYNNNKQIMETFSKKWKSTMKFDWQKNKMDLNIRKMTNHPPSPDTG